MPAPHSLAALRFRLLLTLLSSLVAFASADLGEARADRIRASAAPPLLWTDQNLSSAQRVAWAISDTFGTVHDFGPGTYIGGEIVQITPVEKTPGRGNPFGWTIGTRGSRSSGTSSDDHSSNGDAGGAVVPPTSVGGVTGANATAGALGFGVSSADDVKGNPVPVLSNPLPPSFLLFGAGLGALGLLGWHRKRKLSWRHELGFLP
jgi:hypothetical protein